MLFGYHAIMVLRWNRLAVDRSTEPLVPWDEVETFVELDLPPGNVTIAPDGRIFFDLHPFAQPTRFTDAVLFELVDGEPVPYPSLEFQSEFRGPLGLHVDRHDRLWVIEPKGLEPHNTRLLGFDLVTGERCFELEFTPKQSRFSQDLRVSPDGSTMYLADTGIFTFVKPQLIVLDLETKQMRTALRRHDSVQPQRIATQTASGRHALLWGAVSFRVGVDGIALSADGEWLYYAAINHDGLFRVRRADLDDPTLTEADLGARVERVGDKVLNDGIDIGDDDVLYLTDVEHGGIARMTLDGVVTTLVRSPDVVWADGVVIGPDRQVIFTDSAIPAYVDQLGRPPKRAAIDAAGPFRIYRFTAPD